MNKTKIALLIIGSLFAIILVIFMQTLYWTALTKSKNHFIENSKDKRVLYEPGAENIAVQIADFLPIAIDQVETRLGIPFKKSFKVYVCNTQKSLGEFVAAKSLYPIRGLVLRGDVYMAPSAFNFKGMDTHRETIMHEISHLHFRQQLGFVKDRKIPTWFSEGFADCISNAGGEGISDDEATDYILNGWHFIPNDESKVFGRFHRESKDLSGPMYHKQVKMFVTYLVEMDSLKFKDFLSEIQKGRSFRKSFMGSMGKSIHYYWDQFVSSLE
jgi:hypothetical protein